MMTREELVEWNRLDINVMRALAVRREQGRKLASSDDWIREKGARDELDRRLRLAEDECNLRESITRRKDNE